VLELEQATSVAALHRRGSLLVPPAWYARGCLLRADGSQERLACISTHMPAACYHGTPAWLAAAPTAAVLWAHISVHNSLPWGEASFSKAAKLVVLLPLLLLLLQLPPPPLLLQPPPPPPLLLLLQLPPLLQVVVVWTVTCSTQGLHPGVLSSC
jgi:hypothetical protein